MKEEKKIMEKYNLANFNNDNEIEIDLNKYSINNTSNNENKKEKKVKYTLNYSLILKNIFDNLSNTGQGNIIQNKFKLNLLLMSIKDKSLKLICLELLFKLNRNTTNTIILYYIIGKVIKYFETNTVFNLQSYMQIFKSSALFFFDQKKYYHSYYYIKKAKQLSDRLNNQDESVDIQSLYESIFIKFDEYLAKKSSKFSDEKTINLIDKTINDILKFNLVKNEVKIDNDIENEEYGTYSFIINKDWLINTKIFMDNYRMSKQEMILDSFLRNAFDTTNVLEYYFQSQDKKSGNAIYPGPIDNFNLVKYKDIWEDPNNEDENFVLKNNLEITKDYILIPQREWNILNEVFDSTNEIKRNEKRMKFWEIKALILEKNLKEKKYNEFLKIRTIQVKKNIKIQKLKEKICRSIIFAKKKMENLFLEEDDEEQLKDMNINTNIHFSILNKENKNILLEICIAYKTLLIYKSTYLKEIKLSEEDSIDILFNFYNNKNHILIIEIYQKGFENFLQEIKPIKQPNNNDGKIYYPCSICENPITINSKYNCEKCNMFIFCGDVCSNASGDHLTLHKELSPLLKEEFNLKKLMRRSIIIEHQCREGLAGLYNYGKTCYANCIIHCLSNTLDFTKYFIYDYYKSEQNFQNFGNSEIVEEFARLLKNLWFNTDSVFPPKDFLLAFKRINKDFQINTEQDAQEFLSRLLNSLHERLNRVVVKPILLPKEERRKNESLLDASQRWLKYDLAKDNSFICDLFNGQFVSDLKCDYCGNISTTFDQFNILSVPIPKKRYSVNIKIFFKDGVRYFPFRITVDSTFEHLKNKAYNYFKKDIVENILSSVDGDINLLLKQEKKNFVYNYNNKNLPNYIIYKFLDVIFLNKKKMIQKKTIIDDKEKILSHMYKQDYEIVLYLKETISNKYLNIYATATYFNNENKIFFINAPTITNYSYPVLISVEKSMFIERLDKIFRDKFKFILDRNNPEAKEDTINTVIIHCKQNQKCFYCDKTAKEESFCYLKELFDKNYLCDFLEKEFDNGPIILAGNSKYFFNVQSFNSNGVYYFDQYKQDSYDNEKISLYDCLEKFREEEILTNDNKIFCKICGAKQNFKKKLQIFKIPQYLIIQIKRFKYNKGIMQYFSSNKDETFVDIPQSLDLKEFVLGPDSNNAVYSLYANVLHDENRSHYTTIVYHKNQWVKYNDDSLYYSDFPNSNDSYLLFYKKNNIN